jgi:hypothetical protein
MPLDDLVNPVAGAASPFPKRQQDSCPSAGKEALQALCRQARENFSLSLGH